MKILRRLAAPRLLAFVIAMGVVALQFPATAGVFVDPDLLEEGGGRPMPRPDSPGAANAFRQLQWNNEYGWFPENGLVEAKNHANAMRARGRSAMFPGGGRTSPLKTAPNGASGALQNGSEVAFLGAGVSSTSWTWLGPGNIGGRVRALVVHPTTTTTMFAGSVGGGIFKTINGGATWAPVDDFMANLAVSTIVMKPGTPATMYAGTGEGFYNSDGIRGAGVFMSTDSGTTWSQLASTANSSWFYVNKLAMSPDGAVILAATRSGVFRSTDAGTSWTNTQATEMTGVSFHPTDSTKAIATGYSGNAYFSINGGATWTAATGLPAGSFVRVEAVYAKSTPTTIYASVDANGGSIYKSLNGGSSYAVVFNGAPDYLETQGWYDNTIWVDPTNANNLIVGGIDLWKSTNAGVSLTKISDWSMSPASAHADQHAIVEQPGFNGTTNAKVWFANDGGVYGTTNVSTVGVGSLTAGWNVFNNNLGITQFYGAAGGTTTGVIIGGTQDNGTLKRTTAGGTTWTTEFGGDGGSSAVDPSNNNNLYGEYTYGAIHRSTDGGATADWINGLVWNGVQYVCKAAPFTILDTCNAFQANFIAPFILDPNNSNRMLVGGDALWRSNDATTPNTATTGPSWASIKPASGTGNYISAIAVAPGNSSLIWVGHNNGQLFKTTNGTVGAPTWTASGTGTLPTRFITRVRVDPTAANTVYVTFGGFSTGNVWKTTNGGTSWADASGSGATGLPAVPVRDIAVFATRPSWLYAATEVGLFTSQDGGSTWSVPGDGPANVSIEELFWMGSSLVAVTHGRGLFSATPSTDPVAPVITWPTPAPITVGTALSATQLNATTTVPGTFAYSPAAGTQLGIGNGQQLSVTFTPTDTVNYTTATASVAIDVLKITPVITWPTPADIVYGTALSATQLNATTGIPGTFVYTPAAGTILSVGDGQLLSVTFKPTDTATYAPATATRLINVITPAITIDANVSRDVTTAATSWAATPTFSTTAANELLLAFIGTNGTTATTVSTVTGAGLTWTFVQRTNVQGATAEVWRAFAPSILTNVTVTATISTARSGMLTVLSFKNADTSGTGGSGAIGATGTGNATAAAPSASLTTTRDNSWVFGIGTDTTTSTARTLGSGQTLVDSLAHGTGDFVWVQRTTSPTPASGSNVTINDTAPTGRYNLRTIEVLPPANPLAPTVTLTAPADGAIIAGNATLSANATANSGTIAGVQFVVDGVNLGAEDTVSPYSIAWDSTTATNGPHFITAIARDTAGGTATAGIVTVTVDNDAAPTVTMTAPAASATVSGDSVVVSANASDDVAVLGVQFLLDGSPLGAEDTVAPYAVTWDTRLTVKGAHVLSARARDGVGQQTTSAPVSVTVAKTTPIVTWATPAGIVYGTVLSATQLNATANVPGAFVYTPAAGTVLPAGAAQTLSVTFTPTDSANYATAPANVAIDVAKATPAISWATPANITYGTALGAAQLNATTPVPGTFAYTPAAGAVLTAGAGQTLSTTFTPTDAANYTTATANVAITVLKATPIVSWTAPASITYGTTLSATQLNATANVPGAFVYTPAAGTVLPAGAAQALSVAFTPTDTANYFATSGGTTITVGKATPTIGWSTPADITFGTPLGATQLNATATFGGPTVPGTFVYTPAATTVLPAGAGQTLSVTFTPTDPANYTTATKNVAINVVKATPIVTWNAPSSITHGTALGATHLNATASVPGTFAYTPPAGTILPAGAAQALSVTFTPTDGANYTTATAGVAITVLKATPVITWAAPANIVFGTALGATQLNATASVPGTFVYTPAAGTILSAGAAQSLSVTFTPTDAANFTNATKNVAITVVKATPVITWPTPANIVYGTLLGATQLNASTAVAGSFVYTPAAGTLLTAGAAQALSVTFTPTDTANYNSATAGVTITVVKATPVITWAPPAGIVYGTALSATQLNASASVAGTLVYTPAAGTVLSAGAAQALSVTFTPTDAANYTSATAGVTITVVKATPIITWSTPANITYGTALGAAQLNASASVAGTFVYTPAAATVLSAGAGQSLSVTFTPTDTANYLNATGGVSLTVVKATPVITWTAPASIVYGTALGATQLNATTTVPGTFVYTPPATTVLSAGAAQTLATTFTPTDTANFNTANKSVTIDVAKATPVITWANPADIVYGTALGATQLNATTTIPGTFVYTPPATTVLSAGASQTLSTTFSPTDTANYNTANKSVAITVLKATPVITWTNPAGIVYGTALGATQLNATTTVPGAFVYTPPATTVLSAGAAQTLATTFTPTDTANYNTANKSVTIDVAKATPVITWANPAGIVYGTALGATQLNATTTVPGTFVYTPPATTVLSAGAAQTLSTTFTPTDTANYNTANKSVTIDVAKATLVITWANPADIVYGTALGATQLNATTTIPGTFVYTPPATTVLSAGAAQTLSTTFTPTDAANYNSANKSVAITVLKATPVITWANPAGIVYGTALGATQLNATTTVPGTFVYTPPATTVLSAGAAQTLSTTFTPTDTANYNTANKSVTIDVAKATPVITWANPADIVYGTALGATQLNATTTIPGTFVYTPPATTVLSAGAAQTLSTTFTPTDTANYNTANKSVTIDVAKATPVITWANPAGIIYGTALSATQLNATTTVPGTFVYTPPATTVLSAGAAQTLSTTFTPTDTANYNTANKSVTIDVAKATLVITWANPADIVYGTALGATQLNATTTIPGTFVYTPPATTVLSAGAAQTLATTFTPTDAANYNSANKSVAITVLKATPVITWANPAGIVYGTALGATQLNATTTVPGTFVYTPPATTVLSAGAAQTLSTTFTPTDTANYNTANKSVTIDVAKATPVITWANPADIVYGTALGATQLNATTTIPGTFVYTPPATTVLSAGAAQTLSTTFTPTDTANYNTANKSVTIDVAKATPVITWANPAGIIYGTALSATQLNATTTVPGTFVYTPPATTVLSAGAAQTLSTTFTPTDAANYNTANKSVTIDVAKATPVITWANPADIVYGTALGATQLNATTAIPGTFVYTPPATTVLSAGAAQTLATTFTPTDTANYTNATKAVAVTVTKATPVITWANPADIVYGTALGATQLNATTAIPGTFVYTPPATTVLSAGAAQTLSTTFTPTDAANYTNATKAVAVTVTKATPVITWANPADIVYGTALGATQLNATTAIPGTFVYTPPATTVLSAGAAQTLATTFTPTDAANYNSANKSVAITVLKATPVITWANPAGIVYGTALGATQLNATTTVPGTFVYTPPATTVLSAGAAQTLSTTFTPTDTANYNTANKSVTIDVAKATPVITWANPADIVYGTALGATQLNATTTIPGTFVYTPPATTVLSAGAAQTLSTTFTPTDTANYNTANKSVTINVAKATPVITWANPAGIVYGTALGATQLNATTTVPGTFIYTPAAGEVLAAGAAHSLSVTFTPTDAANYTTATKAVAINVLKATPVITWAPPADIVYGTALSATQLNATTTVAGAFVYTPAAGTVLSAGAAQTLSTTFTPTDTANYTNATKAVAINVLKATPVITWAPPADIVYGTALSATQLNATTTVPGTFVYTPAAGEVLAAGAAHSLSVTFTPTDAVNYTNATKAVAINVLKATPVITWAPPADIVYGTALSATQLNATTTVAGTFVYTPAASTVLSAGTAQSLSVTFTPTDAANYTNATKAVAINVLKATPVITWATPADIVYGTALGATQLTATTTVAGTFVYTPAAGEVLAAGAAHSLSVTFTPADAANYTNATKAVAINVLKATPVITWAPPADIVYGTALSATQLNATTTVPGTFVYTPAAGEVLAAGAAHSLSVTFTPTDAANYTNATKAVAIDVLKATPVITWATPADIVYGTALGATQLNATTTVAGTFVYTPAASTVLSAGTAQSLSVTFTPTDAANYTNATKAVAINVLKATPVITWATPADIVYGTALGATQLTATTTVAGTFVYTPAAGEVLAAGAAHSLSVTFTPTDAANYTNATKAVAINVLKATPVITWVTPADIVYGTALGATQLNATTTVPGTFVYTPAAGEVLAAGAAHSLSVTFTPTDAANYTNATKAVAINVLKATPVITWAPPADIVYGTALSATQLNATTTVAGTFVYTPAASTVLSAGTAQSLSVTFTPTDAANYTNATKAVAIDVLKATPVITWATPADIVYGTALGATQLNATTTVAGTFVYTPAASTVLSAGTAQSLSVTFTPTDAANYTNATKAVAINVLKATPVITWATPADIVYGTALGATQLTATTTVAGTFVYTPAAGEVLAAGAAHSLSVTFTPADAANYTNATKAVAINVLKATPVITWAPPADIVYGTALSATQLNATTTVAGTFVYTPAASTVLSAGTAQTLSVTFTPTDAANYTNATKAVAIDVLKATPVITWATPADIVYGTALGATQLNATTTVAGTFVYTPAAGEVLAAGAAHSLSVTFTPADAANYTNATKAVAINVLKATPVITWTTPADILYGTALSATQLTATTTVAGTFVYTPAAGEVLAAGAAHSLSVTFTPTDAANYTNATKAVAINVLKATPVITWTAPSDIVYGVALGATHLNATASVAGTFAYTPAAGTVLEAGAEQTLSVTFTPTDAANYTNATKAVAINVLKATPVITWATPADIIYGTALGAAQLNATANVAGSFVYTPAAGEVLAAGAAHSLSVTFTPTDSANYTNATNAVAINVLKATPVITWATPADIIYGTALGATQLNATTTVAGTFVYDPTAGTVLSAGAAHALSVTFTPADAANYTNATKAVAINVLKATPVITWTTPADIVYGTALSATQLTATTTMAGTFVYTPAAGEVLAAGAAHSLSVTFTPADAANYTNATRTVAINVLKATPVITWTAPSDIVYGTALGATHLNATASVAGTFAYTPAAGTVLEAGTAQTLSVTFTPTDAANYTNATKAVVINVLKATPVITWATPADIVYGTALGATQLNATTTVPGTFVYTPAAGEVLAAGAAHSLSVTFTPTDSANYTNATNAVAINVLKATPVITWATPADIIYGTALGATQLNATTTVAGTFVYDPTAGTVLSAGAAHALSVTFTPADAANYTNATKAVAINVLKATPVITWTTPADIVYGTALSATQLTATTTMAGTFVYTPAAGEVLAAGAAHSLSVTFTPADAANYTNATRTVAINVLKATPVITWTAPSDIVYGTALGATHLNATASVAGTFAYTPAAGTVLEAGTAQTLSVTFTPTDAANYTNATKAVVINVLKATPVITWATPADIVYGTALGATQLNATTTVPGTFVYTPAAGEVLAAGAAHTLSVTFTPTDAANYTNATKAVAINVFKATPVITWAPPADIVYGTALGATQLNATTTVAGTFAYTPAAGTVLLAGAAQTLSVTFTPTDAANYTTATKSVAINVLKATPVITWTAPADIVYGTGLSATQLNATASVPGTFVYNPAAGTVLPAGAAQSLSVTFTPTDGANYTNATRTVAITVTKATPIVSWTAPANIVHGTALSTTQLNATASVPGTFVYTPPSGAVLDAGVRTLSVTFTPTDAANYASATRTVSLTVTQVTPAIEWTTPYAIIYGTAVNGAQLNATASTPGTFVYSPAAGSVLNAGERTLSVTFTPTDRTNYTVTTSSVTLVVLQAPPMITWAEPANIVVGTPLGAAQLNATSSTPGVFVYSPPAGTVLPAGVAQALTVAFTPNDTQNYSSSTTTVGITVTPTASLTANPTSVGAGGTVTATVANGPGIRTDWIGLYAVGGSTLLDWKYLNGSGTTAPATGLTSASVTFTMPTAQGNYVFRLTSGTTVVTSSATVSVVPTAPSISVNPTNAATGGTVVATVAGGPALAKDWIGLYTVGGSTLLDWKYLNGSQTSPATGVAGASVPFTMPTTPGTYNLRFFTGTSTLLATSATITVTVGGGTSLTFSASPTTVTPGGTVTATITNGPAALRDWVGLFSAAGSMLDWKYLNGTQVVPASGLTSANVSFVMPATPGTYTLQFYSATNTLLATSAPINVSTGVPAVAVNTTTVAPGGTVSVTVTSGPGARTDWVAIFATGASTYVDWRYLNGTQTAPASGLSAATFNLTMPTTVGTYVIRFYTGTSTLLATSQTVTVGTAAASVTVNPATIAPGGTVTATAAGGPANKTDWLALYPTGSTTYITWKYLNGTQTAPATGVSGAAVPFTMPTTTGSYTIKFWAGSTLLATSAPITVGSVPANASVTATPTTVGPLGTVSATIAGGPGNATDWVALYATGASTFVDWKYLNGTKTAPAAGLTGANLSFAVPATPGTYVLKFWAGSTLLATSETITVGSPTIDVSTVTAAPGQVITATVANGPGNRTDWVAIHVTGASAYLDWKYLDGSKTSPATGVTGAAVTFAMPATPGSYTLKFYAGSMVLATSAAIVVQ